MTTADDLRKAVRRARIIGLTTLIVTGGTTISFNVYDAAHAGGMPGLLDVLFGVVPIAVAMGMSELIPIAGGALILQLVGFAVMLGGMVLSMHATGDVIGPVAGTGFRWVFSPVVDAAELVAFYILVNVLPDRIRELRAVESADLAQEAAQQVAHALAQEVAHEPAHAAADEPPQVAREVTLGPAREWPIPVGQRTILAIVSRSAPKAKPEPRREPRVPSEPLGRDAQAAAARQAYRDSVKAGMPLSKRKLAEQFDRSANWAQYRIDEVKNGPQLAQAQ